MELPSTKVVGMTVTRTSLGSRLGVVFDMVKFEMSVRHSGWIDTQSVPWTSGERSGLEIYFVVINLVLEPQHWKRSPRESMKRQGPGGGPFKLRY